MMGVRISELLVILHCIASEVGIIRTVLLASHRAVRTPPISQTDSAITDVVLFGLTFTSYLKNLYKQYMTAPVVRSRRNSRRTRY